MSLNTYNYCCQNSECEVKWKNVDVILTQEESDNNDILCETCKKPMKRLGIRMRGGHLKVASMTPQQRQQVLKKRSREHFSKDKYDKFHKRNMKP